jgi:hypothetical protein
LAKVLLEEQVLEIDPFLQKAIDSLKQQIELFHWLTPQQALQKIISVTSQIFETCILFGYSSQDHSSLDLLTLIEKISRNVIYFTFDREDRDIIEVLEAKFGSAQNIYKKEGNGEIKFSIVEDCIDAVRYCGHLIATSEVTKTTAIICSSDAYAKLVAHELDLYNICYHNEFQTHIPDIADNFIFAWYQYQRYGDLEHFLSFLDLIALQNSSQLSIDYYKYLSNIFHRYPTSSIELLVPYIEDRQILNILTCYPLFPEQDTIHEFVQKALPIFPEICEKSQHFPSNFLVHKNIFLDYILAIYNRTKSFLKEPFYAPIFITDMFSATQFHFDQIIVLCDETSQEDEILSNSSENLFPFLSAQKIYLIAENNHIPLYFAQQYKNTYNNILDSQNIQSLLCSFTVCEESDSQAEDYKFLKQIDEQRNDDTQIFGPFEYTVQDIENPLSISVIEHAVSEPEAIWYRSVLQNDRPNLSFEKNKFEGIFTHDFLHWPKYIFPSFDELEQYILMYHQHCKKTFTSILSKALLQEAIDPSKAFIIAKKLTALKNFPFILNEVDLQATIGLGDGVSLPIHGRVDCILSQYPFRKTFNKDNGENRVLIIDFKTGSMTQNDLIKLTKPFSDFPASLSGLQIVLYGLILESIGYKNIQLLILNADPYDHGEPIALSMITQNSNFTFIQNFLKKLSMEGIFGYGERNPFLRQYFTAPIAIIPPDNRIIHWKREKLFSK